MGMRAETAERSAEGHAFRRVVERVAMPWRNSCRSVQISFKTPRASRVHISSHHQDLARNSFELCPANTAKIQNPNSRQKLGRRVAPTNELNPRRIQNPKGFSTLRVAHRLPIQI